jgi:glutaredoxin
MWIIRWPLGRLILLLNAIFSPQSPKRSAEAQHKLNAATAHLTLYQLPACPFCVKVRRAMKRQGIQLELRNINNSESNLTDLKTHGGSRKVPCLRIADIDQQQEHGKAQWLYESKDIINYLAQFN